MEPLRKADGHCSVNDIPHDHGNEAFTVTCSDDHRTVYSSVLSDHDYCVPHPDLLPYSSHLPHEAVMTVTPDTTEKHPHTESAEEMLPSNNGEQQT